MPLLSRAVLVSALILLAPAIAPAVILYSKPERNISAPRGSLRNSGWQWQGQWLDYLGTPIQKQFFITASHVGGQVGDPFILGGASYTTVATYDDPMSDLQIWRIAEQFPAWATLHKKTDERGRNVVIFGRGTQRGDPITVNDQLKGWLWGRQDGVQSWGKNLIKGVSAARVNYYDADSEIVPDSLLSWSFDRDGVGHESTISTGDSGGGVFTRVGRSWRLIGINYDVDSGFSDPEGIGIANGAIFDAGGLEMDGRALSDSAVDIPTSAYATRVSTRLDWISRVLKGRIAPSAGAVPAAGVPEPAGATTLLSAAALLLRRRRHGGTR